MKHIRRITTRPWLCNLACLWSSTRGVTHWTNDQEKKDFVEIQAHCGNKVIAIKRLPCELIEGKGGRFYSFDVSMPSWEGYVGKSYYTVYS